MITIFLKKLFLAAASLRCLCGLSRDEQGLLFIAVYRLLIAVASLVAEREL